MGRRRKDADKAKWKDSFDWSIDPQTSKEISAILSFALGILFLLSFFGAAGDFGKQTLVFLNSLFGLASFLAAIAFLIMGAGLWKAREVKLKGPTVLGLILLFVFVPGLFGLADAGGSIGNGLAQYLTQTFGSIAAFLILFALGVASALLATNWSLTQLQEWFFGTSAQQYEREQENEPRVSVFQTVKDRMTPKPERGAPVYDSPAPVVAPVKQLTDKNWQLPPIDLLSSDSSKAISGNINKNIEIIQKTFKDFNVTVEMGDVHIGPTVTQYTLKPSEGVKVTNLTARADDLSLALATHPIRIEAPIPGKSAVGIELPNKKTALVTLREILESKEFGDAKSKLSIAFGRDVAGSAFISDLSSMPHLLIAGSTGSGKSVAINSIIMSFLFQNSPADLRMILIDPKRVEFTQYNGIPHLLTSVVTEVDKILNTLRWTVAEMERRYRVFAEVHKRNIDEYNSTKPEEAMPRIVVIIDELADLMMQSASEAESAIVRISQLARATGIHLIVATQRPSVDVITGLIKANIPTRVAFAVASGVDSRTILDQPGADKLLGKGDMLYLGNDVIKPKRVQGVLITEKEVEDVTQFLKKDGEMTYDESIQEYKAQGRSASGQSTGEGDIDDDMYEEAKQVVVDTGKASASYLQRRLRVGYARAARLLDMLEQESIIGPSEGSKPRPVLVTREMIEQERRSAPQGNYGQPATPKQYPSDMRPESSEDESL